MLAAVVLPSPPLLVPAIAGGAAEAMTPLLEICERAVADLLAAGPGAVVLLGSGAVTRVLDAGAWGSLDGFGVAAGTASRHDGGPPELPLGLSIGRWLLERAGWDGGLVVQEVAASASAAECASLGAGLAGRTAPDAAWLVVGDGSICRGPKSPGYDDPRAEGFDAAVAAALAGADLGALRELDVRVATELGVAGRPVWQVLAAAAQAEPPVAAELRYEGAPFGVGYFVSHWRFAA